MGQHLHCHHPIPAELLTDDGRDAAGVAGGFIARDDRPTDSNGNLVDAHLHPRRT
ncbi:pecM-like domain protein [Escherichia coli 2-222-05_S3_C3]|nr:pecM-like domain protein [Escherichia coli 2-222-05_S3_C3]